ncbi:MAG: hypothetical protein IJY72_03635, partial [Akkermansia sp.]|nr:hypothetical protein [Akkermansia sp.]
DIRLGASALAYAHPGRRTISLLRMDDIPVFDRNYIREPGLADVGLHTIYKTLVPVCGSKL